MFSPPENPCSGTSREADGEFSLAVQNRSLEMRFLDLSTIWLKTSKVDTRAGLRRLLE